MPHRPTVLIVKVGYCETLVREEGFVPSLGDVFRHTVLLHHYSDYRVTWLTSESAMPLLADNDLIAELLTYDEKTTAALLDRHFDEVLCLEKAPTLCDFARSVSADRHRGFGWDGVATRAHSGAESALEIANGKEPFLPIQALLFQMVGDHWRGEGYVLGYRPRPTTRFDVGLNYKVGSKWPSKQWPLAYWKGLEKLCKRAGLSTSWQQGTNDLSDYMDWINAAGVVVTCDSLGMHLGLAMEKKVIALFGPTPSENIHLYGQGVLMRAQSSCPVAPCMQPDCRGDCRCMSGITPEMVAATISFLAASDSEAVDLEEATCA